MPHGLGSRLFKFIHTADIHLDSPLLNLEQYDGAPVDALRVATRDAFDNVVKLAIDEQVDFLLIAGDLYDKDSPDFNTPRHVRKKLVELAEHNISVHIIQGNHDATTVAKRAFDTLTLPDNVQVYSTKRAETHIIESLDVAVHGQGFSTRAVEEDLSADYPMALSGYFNIGLLHTNLGGNQTHDNYAPSTAEGLRAKGYEYWALGHIHKRDKGLGGPTQLIHYPGNTQGRHIRETGAKGCSLVTVDDNARISVKFHATDVWRWLQLEVDVTEYAHAEDAIAAVRPLIDRALQQAEDRSLAVRVVMKGQSTAHLGLLNESERWKQQLRRDALDAFEDRVWIEKLRVRTSDPVVRNNEQRDAAYGELVAAIFDVVPNEAAFAEIRADLEKVLKQIPSDSRLDAQRIDLEDESTVVQLVQEAKELLVARLIDVDQQGAA